MSLDVSKPLPPLKRFRGRHFLTDLDYTREELEALLHVSVKLKTLWKNRQKPAPAPAPTPPPAPPNESTTSGDPIPF